MSIVTEHLSYIYNKDTAYERKALDDINISINDGEYVAIIGHTGSGKSTLVQHFNGLYKPTEGTVKYNNEDIFDKKYSKKALRSQVGLVFQYPEYQLFADTVIADVMFGPHNIGMDENEAYDSAKNALDMVGIPKKLYDVPPFNISGGERRRVAIAGVLAMNPKVLILDEPAAGLDPCGRKDILELVSKLHKERKLTVIMVSHSMDDVAEYAEHIIVMNEGKVFAEGIPSEIFAKYKELEKIGLMAPQTVYLVRGLNERGFCINTDIVTPDEAVEEILRQKEKGCSEILQLDSITRKNQ